MNDQLISFETAKLAKERGFDYNIYGGYTDYNEDGDLLDEVDERWYKQILYPAPTQSLLQKWLRDEHKIHISILPVNYLRTNVFRFVAQIETMKYLDRTKAKHKTYEEAMDKALEEGLKLIENE